ncbi:MAG: trypsin-like peptidase domain-containing protein, partial [Planctomycetaceae bacterium]|nr:trypsin-like peptidase domain-containing protein [Planctomycetaceae bacterium]
MKQCLGYFCSALLGGVFAVWLTQGGSVGELSAQVGPTLEPPGANQRPNASNPSLKFSPPVPIRQEAQENRRDGLTTEEAVNVAVYENCNRSVVNITTQGSRNDGFFAVQVPERGSGSGVVIDRTGHILTNYHVIENARQVEITIYDGKSYKGQFVGADPINDLAVLKIDAPKEVLFPAILGDSNGLKVGMKVFAIGNPFGLERTMTTGIISSLNRSLQIRGNRSIRSIIQLDADINPGNSGGPLLSARGHLIGLTTAIASQNGQSAGVGFAIPINL